MVNLYPEHRWIPWKFLKVTVNFWTIENQRLYFNYIGNLLGIYRLEDWYQISLSSVDFSGITHQGSQKSFYNKKKKVERTKDREKQFLISFLQLYYKKSLIKALMTVYNDFKWKPWKFQKLPHSFWKDKKNQRDFMDSMGDYFGLKHWEDWYRLRYRDLVRYGGEGLTHALKRHSLHGVLQSVYPEHPWQLFRFEVVPRHYWDDETHVKMVLEYVKKTLDIKILDDWFKFTAIHLNSIGLNTPLKRYKGLEPLLMKFYPEYEWPSDPKAFKSNNKKQQLMAEHIGSLFKEHKVVIRPSIY